MCGSLLLPLLLLLRSQTAPGSDVTQQQAPQQSSPAPQPFWQASAWSFGSHCEQNRRNHMEDRFAAADLSDHAAFGATHRAGFFAVYDGHSGHEAAEYLESHLQSYVLAAGPDALAADPLRVLSDAVQQAEAEILASHEAGRGSDTAGSTLCAILLVDDKLHVAHVGDSRAVLGRGAEPIQLTRDHKPGCQIEAARIEQVSSCAPSSVLSMCACFRAAHPRSVGRRLLSCVKASVLASCPHTLPYPDCIHTQCRWWCIVVACAC